MIHSKIIEILNSIDSGVIDGMFSSSMDLNQIKSTKFEDFEKTKLEIVLSRGTENLGSFEVNLLEIKDPAFNIEKLDFYGADDEIMVFDIFKEESTKNKKDFQATVYLYFNTLASAGNHGRFEIAKF